MLVDDHPNLVSKIQIGQSFENRSLYVLKVGTKVTIALSSPPRRTWGLKVSPLHTVQHRGIESVGHLVGHRHPRTGMGHSSHRCLDSQQGNHVPWDMGPQFLPPAPFNTFLKHHLVVSKGH